jgi:hypothetical protein
MDQQALLPGTAFGAPVGREVYRREDREMSTDCVRAASLLSQLCGGTAVNWFNLSFVGWLVVIVALALVAYKFDVQPFWIGIGALLLLGVGIITSVKNSKPRI